MELLLSSIALLFAAIPALLFRRNLGLYKPPPAVSGPLPALSVLIPARNEERNISAAVDSVLANRGVDLEVIVLDDHSADSTADIVNEIAVRDARVRLEAAPPLPSGWCGKQYACSRLAGAASNQVLCFMDADVRLSAEALARMAGYLESSGAALVSGFPRQETGTLLEKLVIPMIHFILLGFLPLERMRASAQPAYAAGCGQLMLARRSAYIECGGHSAIRDSLHDGLKLPRVFRSSGFRTDLFDATDLATCRMYSSARDVWCGLAKNAIEGMAAPSRIVFFSLLLGAGQILPLVLLFATHGRALAVSALAALLAWYPRFAAAARFRQPFLGAILHPVGITLLLAIQWYALVRSLLGRRSGWKGREYVPAR
jgi:glycosyltransferase involved in cell wall biosynthesis